MTRKEAKRIVLEQLQKARTGEDMDPESAHGVADCALEQYLLNIGDHDIFSAYAAIQPKWYA